MTLAEIRSQYNPTLKSKYSELVTELKKAIAIMNEIKVINDQACNSIDSMGAVSDNSIIDSMRKHEVKEGFYSASWEHFNAISEATESIESFSERY